MTQKMNDRRIDAAIETYPIASLPSGFVQRTMKRINIEFRFRWQFIDIVLPVFFFLFSLLCILVAAWLLQMIDPLWLPQVELQIRMSLLIMPTWAKWLGLGGIFLGTTALGAIFTSALVIFSRPRISHYSR